MPKGTAVVRKIRSPQTIGVECPLPGRATFQRTFLVSLHSTGGSAFGAAPVPNGPRHCGQSVSAARDSTIPNSRRSQDSTSNSSLANGVRLMVEMPPYRSDNSQQNPYSDRHCVPMDGLVLHRVARCRSRQDELNCLSQNNKCTIQLPSRPPRADTPTCFPANVANGA